MSRQEITSEIQKILSNLSDENLQAVLAYLKQAQMIDGSKLVISKKSGKNLKRRRRIAQKTGSMIQIEDVKSIHCILINQFGGSQEIRDESALEAAIARPYSTFDGKEL